ncbi:MAG TPA: hypothetical protein VMT53_24745 [Terriglobales bacterium]|nr:hypothetical protein [Terriglobales bacterium]
MISITLTILLCCTPELLFAVAGQNGTPQNEQAAAVQTGTAPPGAAGAPSTIPDAPQAQGQQNATSAPSTAGQNPVAGQQEPEGTAAARAAKTIGGPASKPAGSAIAPAKQRQVRSLLIKIGAIAAAGAALGTVYAVTRGTPSKPPGAH